MGWGVWRPVGRWDRHVAAALSFAAIALATYIWHPFPGSEHLAVPIAIAASVLVFVERYNLSGFLISLLMAAIIFAVAADVASHAAPTSEGVIYVGLLLSATVIVLLGGLASHDERSVIIKSLNLIALLTLFTDAFFLAPVMLITLTAFFAATRFELRAFSLFTAFFAVYVIALLPLSIAHNAAVRLPQTAEGYTLSNITSAVEMQRIRMYAHSPTPSPVLSGLSISEILESVSSTIDYLSGRREEPGGFVSPESVRANLVVVAAAKIANNAPAVTLGLLSLFVALVVAASTASWLERSARWAFNKILELFGKAEMPVLTVPLLYVTGAVGSLVLFLLLLSGVTVVGVSSPLLEAHYLPNLVLATLAFSLALHAPRIYSLATQLGRRRIAAIQDSYDAVAKRVVIASSLMMEAIAKTVEPPHGLKEAFNEAAALSEEIRSEIDKLNSSSAIAGLTLPDRREEFKEKLDKIVERFESELALHNLRVLETLNRAREKFGKAALERRQIDLDDGETLLSYLSALKEECERTTTELLDYYVDFARALSYVSEEETVSPEVAETLSNSIKAMVSEYPLQALRKALESFELLIEEHKEEVAKGAKWLASLLASSREKVKQLLSDNLLVNETFASEVVNALTRVVRELLTLTPSEAARFKAVFEETSRTLPELVEEALNAFEEEVSLASRYSGASRETILDLLGLNSNYKAAFSSPRRVNEFSRRAIEEAAGELPKAIKLVCDAARARERCISYRALSPLIESELVASGSLSVEAIPLTDEDALWVAKLFAKLNYSKVTLQRVRGSYVLKFRSGI